MGMVSAAVLYDRITDSGVFSKRSGVGVSLIGGLQEVLFNSLKFVWVLVYVIM